MYFYLVLLGMLAFSVVIDRLEAAAVWLASGRRSKQVFLERVNAEVMMFGFVGLGVFLFSQIKQPSSQHFEFFEFVDIFCSLSAVVIILMAVVLLMIQHRLEKKYVGLHASEEGNHRDVQAQVQQVKLLIMRERFFEKHSLPPDFDFTLYLRESLAKNVCDIMDIKWGTWVAILSLVVIFTVVRRFQGPLFQMPESYMMAYVIAAWVIWICHLMLWCVVRHAYEGLEEDLGVIHIFEVKRAKFPEGEPSASSAEEKAVAVPLGHQQATVIERSLQILAICHGGLWAMYFMHLIYNISHSQLSYWWHPALMLPLFMTLLAQLPSIVARFSLVQAYYVPDHGVLDDTISQSAQSSEDLLFIRRQLSLRSGWERQLPKEFRGSKELSTFLRNCQIFFAEERVDRVFQAIDKDASDNIDALEFVMALGEGTASLQLVEDLTESVSGSDEG